MCTLAKSEDTDETPHNVVFFIRVYTVCLKKIYPQRKECIKNLNGTIDHPKLEERIQ